MKKKKSRHTFTVRFSFTSSSGIYENSENSDFYCELAKLFTSERILLTQNNVLATQNVLKNDIFKILSFEESIPSIV